MNKFKYTSFFLSVNALVFVFIINVTDKTHNRFYSKNKTELLVKQNNRLDSLKNNLDYNIKTYYTVSVCQSIDETPRKFIGVDIIIDSCEFLLPLGAHKYSIIIYDSSYYVKQVCFSNLLSTTRFGGLFSTDAFLKFEDEVSILLCYGNNEIVRVDGVNINEFIEPLDTKFLEKSYPSVNERFLKKNGLKDGLVYKLDDLKFEWW